MLFFCKYLTTWENDHIMQKSRQKVELGSNFPIYIDALKNGAGIMPDVSSDCLGLEIMVHFYSFSLLSYSGHLILWKPSSTTTNSERKTDHDR